MSHLVFFVLGIITLLPIFTCFGQTPALVQKDTCVEPDKSSTQPLTLYVEQTSKAPATSGAQVQCQPKLIYFDRTKDKEDDKARPPKLDEKDKQAIKGSNALLRGTLYVSANKIKGCATRDWTIAVLARETSSVIVYRPGDISVFCDETEPEAHISEDLARDALQKEVETALKEHRPPNLIKPSAPTLDDSKHLFAVLPVDAVWVQFTGYLGNLNDPGRKAPGKINPVYCWEQKEGAYSSPAQENQVLKPCDLFADERTNDLKKGFYKSGWLYNRTTAPGVWSGTFSLAPVVTSGGAQTLNEDIRFYGSSKAGMGWLGLNVQFEKGTKLPSNLNSLTSALTYDIHLSDKPVWFATNKTYQSTTKDNCLNESNKPKTCVLLQDPKSSGIGVRPGEVIVGTGQEYAVTRPKGPNGEHLPKDLNLSEAISYRQPITVTLHKYPSLLTLFPMVGVEGGWHLIRYENHEGAQLFRKVVGADISLRWPFNLAPNFISTKGGTIDYSFRARFLSGNEPYTETATGISTLSRQDRTYTRITLNLPFTNYVALTTSVQRGSLPPDFYNVSWAFTVGLSLASTGTAEH